MRRLSLLGSLLDFVKTLQTRVGLLRSHAQQRNSIRFVCALEDSRTRATTRPIPLDLGSAEEFDAELAKVDLSPPIEAPSEGWLDALPAKTPDQDAVSRPAVIDESFADVLRLRT